MIGESQIAEILSLYRKHGLILRRVLLSDPLKDHLSAAANGLFGETEIRSSEIDAAWFSRKSKTGEEAWELRRLSETPFALLEIFDEEDDREIREEALAEVESRLFAARR